MLENRLLSHKYALCSQYSKIVIIHLLSYLFIHQTFIALLCDGHGMENSLVKQIFIAQYYEMNYTLTSLQIHMLKP